MLRFWYSDRSSATFLLTHPIPRAAKYLSPLSRSFFISSHSPNKLCRIVVSRGFVTVPAIIFAWGMSPHLAIFVWYNFPWWRHFGAQVMGALNQSINSDVFIRIWLTIILLINLYVCFSGNILLFFYPFAISVMEAVRQLWHFKPRLHIHEMRNVCSRIQ